MFDYTKILLECSYWTTKVTTWRTSTTGKHTLNKGRHVCLVKMRGEKSGWGNRAGLNVACWWSGLDVWDLLLISLLHVLWVAWNEAETHACVPQLILTRSQTLHTGCVSVLHRLLHNAFFYFCYLNQNTKYTSERYNHCPVYTATNIQYKAFLQCDL